jgi:hypothetical protein
MWSYILWEENTLHILENKWFGKLFVYKKQEMSNLAYYITLYLYRSPGIVMRLHVIF